MFVFLNLFNVGRDVFDLFLFVTLQLVSSFDIFEIFFGILEFRFH